jgi:hypothetical protein
MCEDFQRLFSCCLRSNQIADLNFNDSSNSYIYLGINALNICKSKRLILADYGSSYTENSIKTMKLIVEYLRQMNKLRESPLIIHIDLPTNNWTRFFQILTNDNSYYRLIIARSFYEQCLPTNSLSIGYSCASLHYLSEKPCNIHNHCYIHFADENERDRFRQQSKFDFERFIELRSRELRSGGILILNIPCLDENKQMDFNRYFDLIYQCAQRLLSKELEDFTLPFYLRSLSECMDLELFKRCSLKLIKVELIRLKSLIFYQYQNQQITLDQFAKSLIVLMQSSIESILKQTLEIHGRTNEEIEHIFTQFWSLFEEQIKSEVSHDVVNTYATYLILKKK